MGEPRSVSEIDASCLSSVAGKMLGRPVQVTGFEIISDPFEFPRFGEKEFYEVPFSYESAEGGGKSTLVLRVMPEMDAVMMLTGDTEHRELKAFKEGLFEQVPDTFSVPYVHVVDDAERKQYWAWLRDVRPQMEALGMHAKVSDDTCRTILSHLAAFHAAFWEKREVLDKPWLMSLEQPVNFFYRCVNDILDGMRDPAESSVYITERWPWLAEGVVNLVESLPAGTKEAVQTLYREPEALLAAVNSMPQTLCHYDFDNRNLGIEQTPSGLRTVVIDWEILGRGVSASDVVRFTVYQQPDDLEGTLDFYLDELEARLGEKIDRAQWRKAYDLGSVAEWQIRGVLFGVMVSAPSAPVPEEHREAMRERVFSDISLVEDLARKHALV
jgi:hypothetical protein